MATELSVENFVFFQRSIDTLVLLRAPTPGRDAGDAITVLYEDFVSTKAATQINIRADMRFKFKQVCRRINGLDVEEQPDTRDGLRRKGSMWGSRRSSKRQSKRRKPVKLARAASMDNIIEEGRGGGGGGGGLERRLSRKGSVYHVARNRRASVKARPAPDDADVAEMKRFSKAMGAVDEQPIATKTAEYYPVSSVRPLRAKSRGNVSFDPTDDAPASGSSASLDALMDIAAEHLDSALVKEAIQILEYAMIEVSKLMKPALRRFRETQRYHVLKQKETKQTEQKVFEIMARGGGGVSGRRAAGGSSGRARAVSVGSGSPAAPLQDLDVDLSATSALGLKKTTSADHLPSEPSLLAHGDSSSDSD